MQTHLQGLGQMAPRSNTSRAIGGKASTVWFGSLLGACMSGSSSILAAYFNIYVSEALYLEKCAHIQCQQNAV